MCLEGGCGVCIVAVSAVHPLTNRKVLFCVNSVSLTFISNCFHVTSLFGYRNLQCLVSIFSCNGWTIETIEGIGNKQQGYHPLQKILAAYNGTQCGFCTQGWVMNMYTLYERGTFTMQDVENYFGSNLCRCTGYRSILTAFKSLASDADSGIVGEYPDIEDFEKCIKSDNRCQKQCNKLCSKMFSPPMPPAPSNSKWFKVYSVREIFDVFGQNPNRTYMLVAGNTARGKYIHSLYLD